MGWDVYTETTPTARKKYHCDASDAILDAGYDERDYTQEEWAKIEKARSEGWRILPGTKYVKVTGIWEGQSATVRARPELADICHKYGLWDDC